VTSRSRTMHRSTKRAPDPATNANLRLNKKLPPLTITRRRQAPTRTKRDIITKHRAKSSLHHAPGAYPSLVGVISRHIVNIDPLVHRGPLRARGPGDSRCDGRGTSQGPGPGGQPVRWSPRWPPFPDPPGQQAAGPHRSTTNYGSWHLHLHVLAGRGVAQPPQHLYCYSQRC